MKARIVSAVAVLALAATCLTACRTNVGTAAKINGQRISENTVNDYVLSSGPTDTTSSTATTAPKPLVLQYLVLRAVYRKTLAANGNGGVPSAASLAAVHDKAVTLLLQSQITGSKFDAGVKSQLTKAGVKASLAPIFTEVQELEYTLVERKKLASPADVVTTIAKAGVAVRINPRYGTWVSKGQDLGIDVSGSTPSYLKLRTTAAAQPAS